MRDACAKGGREPSPGPKLAGWLTDAGFVDVTDKVIRLPLGRWPKDPKLVRLRS
jgi:hypothetical protein